MDNAPLLDVHQPEVTAPDFVFGDHIEDTRKEGHPDIRPSRIEKDYRLSYPQNSSLKELGLVHSLQRLEQQFLWVFDNKNASLGYTKDHSLTPISCSGTHRHRILEPYRYENVDFDYSREIRPLVLSLFHQPRASFPGNLKPKGSRWQMGGAYKLYPLPLSPHIGEHGVILCY